MTDNLRDLAHSLDALVRGVPGVVTLFSADPALVRSARQLAAGEDAIPLVAVSGSQDALRITVSIGVDAGEQAPLTASIVAAAIRAALPGGDAAEVSVRVSRVSA